MRKITAAFGVLGTIAVLYLSAAPAQAQTWVSGTGNNGNDCFSPATPCRQIGGAIGALAKTSARGTIHVLPGHYDEVVIDKSVQIIADGEQASIVFSSVSSGGIDAAIVVNAGPTDVVRIRGMIVNQAGFFAASGVGFVAGKALHLENCTLVASGGAYGIQFAPTGAAKLFVSDSHITDNGSSGLAAGISIKPASGVTANVTIDRTHIENNQFGIIADGNGGGSIRGVVRDSVVSGNINNGITVTSSGAGAAVLMIENTTVSGNNFGLAAGGASSGMLVSHSSIVLNNTGLFTTGGGLLLSYKNNNVNGNATTDGTFTGVVGQQ